MAIDPLIADKISFILGWINILGLVLVLLSCRCIFNIKITRLNKSRFYLKFYKYHCYYWRLFILSVLAHAILAIVAFGNPFS